MGVFLVYIGSPLDLHTFQKSLAPLSLELQFRQPKPFPLGTDESSPKGATDMDKERMAELVEIEAHSAENG